MKKLSLLTAGGMLAGNAAPAFASKGISVLTAPSKKIGLQIYSLAKELTDDVPAGMKKIADIGYSYIELAGYLDRKMGKYKVDEYRRIVEDAGLEIKSSHVNPPVRE
ncbi:MAG: sugar phosphate isomerase/epimerase, partial [Bacteroidales bacterium]